MSIERAQADLKRAESESTKLTAQLAMVRRKIEKLENYIEMARTYSSDDGEEEVGRRRENGPPQVQAVINILRARGSRAPTSFLVQELERQGHHVGGENQITNLSSALSRSTALVSNRSEGWGLVEWSAPAVQAETQPAKETSSRKRFKYKPSQRILDMAAGAPFQAGDDEEAEIPP